MVIVGHILLDQGLRTQKLLISLEKCLKTDVIIVLYLQLIYILLEYIVEQN